MCERNGWTEGKGRVEVSFENGRRQDVRIELFEFEGQSLARLYSTVGSASRIRPARLAALLGVNFKLPHGALATKGDDLVIVDTLMVERAADEEIEASIRYLAEMADHYERTIFGPDDH